MLEIVAILMPMRYIDSGTRDASHAVATWLNQEFNDQVAALRIQSGFFSRDALRPYISRLEGLVASGGDALVVVGSNDGLTLASHLSELVKALGLPRDRSQLGVVYLSGAFFHPKTLHICRADGSQAAYVGSANFTLPGIAAKHIEAGVLLDTREGDPPQILQDIAQATDAWFSSDRPGVERVREMEDVTRLLQQGVLSASPPPRLQRPISVDGTVPTRPSQPYLVSFGQNGSPGTLELSTANQAALSFVQRTPPYPPYMFFAPDAQAPTFGAEALTGTGLGAATGLIARLSRDNDRHWREAGGTANLNVPVSTASSIRFGIYERSSRPRAEFDMLARYVDDEVEFRADPATTSLMSYGYLPGDSGHGDLRLVLPKPPISALREQLVAAGLALPKAGDLALLEWPTLQDPTFRTTFVKPQSALGEAISTLWAEAAASEQLASRGACWLPAHLSPSW